MPLKSGSSSSTVSSNIKELHSGKTYARTESKFGKHKADKQAVAIALSNARKTGRAMGGPVAGMMTSPAPTPIAGMPAGLGNAAGMLSGQPNGLAGGMASGLALKTGGAAGFNPSSVPAMMERSADRAMVRGMTKGPILSAVPGRTDNHATHVPSGSYVIPADIVSGRGQGNTIAGAASLQKLFRMGPYGTVAPKMGGHSPGMPRAGFPKAPKATAFHSGGGKGGKDDAHVGKPVRVNLAGGEVVVPPEHLKAVVHKDLKTAHEIMDRWVVRERKKLRKTLAKLPGPVRS